MRAPRLWLSALMCVFVLALGTTGRAQVFNVISGKLELEGHVFVAREAGAVVRLHRGINMRVSPGTRLYKVHKRARLWLTNKGRIPTHVVALERGRVDIENSNRDRAVLVRSSLNTANALRSPGRMSIVAAPGEITIANHEGSVIWAMGASRFSILEPTKIKTLTKHSQSDAALLEPTQVHMEQNLYGGFGRSAPVSGVSWQAVPGAVRYLVHIDQLEPERRVAAQVETAGLELSSPPRLPAGRYALSVRAIDRHGIEGHASRPEAFSVVGVRTSDGGYIDDRGNIVAGYDRRVSLTYADGLIMKGGPIDWGPIPDEIVLPSAEPMNLHVRQAGDTRLLSTRVIAHQVKALVSVGPKRLRWPGESAQIEVSIAGPEGGQAPAWIEPRFRVLLGIDELDVAWTKVDDKYVAEVPSRDGPGPWVVRVEVEDQYGHAIGRDFVEIAPREPLPAPPAAPAPAAPATSPPAHASR